MKKTLLFFVAEDWYFCSHRFSLALAAQKAGYRILVVTRVREHGELIRAAGFKLIPFEMSRSGLNPFQEVITLLRLIRIYHKEKPDIVHHVSMKPMLYGMFAALFSMVPSAVNTVAGMGALFISDSPGPITRLIRKCVTISLALLCRQKGRRMIVQNPDDLAFFYNSLLFKRERLKMILGSGVDIQKFHPMPEPDGIPIVVLAARLLWDKGVNEFVEAARCLKQSGIKARFVLVGKGDVENPANIDEDILIRWEEEGCIELWGHRSDMPTVFANCHIVCLPSYREGLPKVLIEAASCGRPIVTTDAPGCREVVEDGINGICVSLRCSSGVVEALEKLIGSPELRRHMGQNGRKIVEERFGQSIVNDEMLCVYREVGGAG